MATTSAILALVVVLNTAATTQETVVATLSESECLAAMRDIWEIPAETVAFGLEGRPIPALDAYCVNPAALERNHD